jgi:hypothetical protein
MPHSRCGSRGRRRRAGHFCGSQLKFCKRDVANPRTRNISWQRAEDPPHVLHGFGRISPAANNIQIVSRFGRCLGPEIGLGISGKQCPKPCDIRAFENVALLKCYQPYGPCYSTPHRHTRSGGNISPRKLLYCYISVLNLVGFIVPSLALGCLQAHTPM